MRYCLADPRAHKSQQSRNNGKVFILVESRRCTIRRENALTGEADTEKREVAKLKVQSAAWTDLSQKQIYHVGSEYRLGVQVSSQSIKAIRTR